MLRSERLEYIYSKLLKEGSVLTSELSEQMGVSEVTIRKDLLSLSDKYPVEKTYGGAVLIKEGPGNSGDEGCYVDSGLYEKNNIRNYSEKTAIAQCAAEMIDDGDIIFLGSGSTCCILAELLENKKNLSIVTNNISAISTLVKHNHKVYLIGGEISTVDSATYFSSIENPVSYLESICVNKVFTSCYGISKDVGITVNSIISSYMYKAIPQIQKKWYLMAENDKFNKVGMYKVASFSEIESVITDCVNETYGELLRKESVGMICAENKK